MERYELSHFLQLHQIQPLDTERLQRERKPEIVYVENVPVFLFHLSYDIYDSPIYESISISQQPVLTFIPLHMHNYIEIMFVYKGSCTVNIGGQSHLLRAGEIIMIDKATPHSVEATSSKDIVITIIMKHDFLSPSFLGRLSKQSIISQFMMESLVSSRKRYHFLTFRSGNLHKVTEILENIMCEFFDQDFFSKELIDSYLIVLFSLLIRHSHVKDTLYVNKPDHQKVSIVDFLSYIEEHFVDCHLHAMAAHFGFHPNYLSSLLKKGTGKSFKQLLQLQRINQAALLLSNSSLSIPEIAEQVGYSSVTFFYKKFKELFRTTPHHYREINKHELYSFPIEY